MSYNGSGTFQINTSGQPVVAGTVISSTAFNALTADLATGLSTAITKDGQTTTTARIPFAAGIDSSLTTDSTSTATGSIITSGGVGIAKALYVGTTANVAGAATLSSTLTYGGVTLTNAVTGTGKMVLGTGPTIGTPTLGSSSTDTVLITGAPSIGGAGLGMGMGFRNRIINGAMVIDQRNAGASVTATVTSARTYVLDRWGYFTTQASKFTVQQNAGSVTPPAGFRNYIGITSSSAYTPVASDIIILQQPIEGYNVYDLNFGSASASTITFSFWVRSSLTGTFAGSLGNSANSRLYPFTFTISSANTWEQKTITVTGDTSGTWVTDNGIGLYLNFNLGTGSTYLGTAGAWTGSAFYSATGGTNIVATNGATFYITGVQLEKGSTATSFDYRPFGTELQLCQRYAQSTFPLGTAWAQNAGVTNASITNGTGNSGFGIIVPWRFQVRMRATPATITTYNPSAANSSARNLALTADKAIAVYGFSSNGMDAIAYLITTSVADSVGMGYAVHFSVDAEL
jgi:hypothetical protein